MRSACITSKGSTEEFSCRAPKPTGSHLTDPVMKKWKVCLSVESSGRFHPCICCKMQTFENQSLVM